MSRYDVTPTHCVEAYMVTEAYPFANARTDRYFYPNEEDARGIYATLSGHLRAKTAKDGNFNGVTVLVTDMMGEATIVIAQLQNVRLVNCEKLWDFEFDMEADKAARIKRAKDRANRGLGPK